MSYCYNKAFTDLKRQEKLYEIRQEWKYNKKTENIYSLCDKTVSFHSHDLN